MKSTQGAGLIGDEALDFLAILSFLFRYGMSLIKDIFRNSPLSFHSMRTLSNDHIKLLQLQSVKTKEIYYNSL